MPGGMILESLVQLVPIVLVHTAGIDCLVHVVQVVWYSWHGKYLQIEQIVWQRWHTGVGDGEMMVEACSDGRNNLPQLPSLPSRYISYLHTPAKQSIHRPNPSKIGFKYTCEGTC